MKKPSFIAAASALAIATLAIACADLQTAIGEQLTSNGSSGDDAEECEDAESTAHAESEHGAEGQTTTEEEQSTGSVGECGATGATGPDLADSCCGFPGDRGNELGVGQFCTRDEHCSGNAEAKVCSSFENGLTDHVSFFCTIACDPDVQENVCGTGARCNCEEVGCGCVPIACLENPPAHCEAP
jgi:hypothetical protein